MKIEDIEIGSYVTFTSEWSKREILRWTYKVQEFVDKFGEAVPKSEAIGIKGYAVDVKKSKVQEGFDYVKNMKLSTEKEIKERKELLKSQGRSEFL